MKNLILAALLFSLSPSVFSKSIMDTVSNLETLGTVPICAEEDNQSQTCGNPAFGSSKLDDLPAEKKRLILLYEHHKLVTKHCYNSSGKFQPHATSRASDSQAKNFWVPFTCPGDPSDLVWALKGYVNATEPLSEKLKQAKSRLDKMKGPEKDEVIEAELASFCYQTVKANSEPKKCDYSSLTFSSAATGSGKTTSKFDGLDKIISGNSACDKKVAAVQAWASGFRAGDLDEQVLFELIKKDPQASLNNPQFMNMVKVVNLRSIPGAANRMSGDGDSRLLISTYSNALISVENDVLKSMNISNSNDFHRLSPSEQRKALDQIVPRYLEVLDKPVQAEQVAKNFAKECDAKASRTMVGDEAICTVSGFSYAQKTHEYTNVSAYDSGPDGRFHCYPDKNFKNNKPSEGVYAPEGFSQSRLGYGSSCMMGSSFAAVCAKAKSDKYKDDSRYEYANKLCASADMSNFSGSRTISSYCGQDPESPPCRAAREACQDSRIIDYPALGCHKKGITFNPSHINGIDSVLNKKPGKTAIGSWGGCGSSHPGSDGAHSHNQFTSGAKGVLVDPVNVFCRGDCF